MYGMYFYLHFMKCGTKISQSSLTYLRSHSGSVISSEVSEPASSNKKALQLIRNTASSALWWLEISSETRWWGEKNDIATTGGYVVSLGDCQSPNWQHNMQTLLKFGTSQSKDNDSQKFYKENLILLFFLCISFHKIQSHSYGKQNYRPQWKQKFQWIAQD